MATQASHQQSSFNNPLPVALMYFILAIIFSAFLPPSAASDWPQASGPRRNFQTEGPAPTAWSVVADQNIKWKVELPETGQSTPVISGDRVFFTTMKPVESDSTVGKDIVAWCVSSKNGDVLWKKDIQGKHPLRLSGCFSDSSSPAAVCSNDKVVFMNASGTIACFTFDGDEVWTKPILSVGRTLPFLHQGNVVFIRQIYPPEPDGNFPHKYKDSPRDMWTQLQAISIESGDVAWTTECGCNMGCAPLQQTLEDRRSVAVVGRGGGHGPPEKPEGISLVDLRDGSTIWTLPLPGFMSTQTVSHHAGQFHLFHKDKHLSVNAKTGKIEQETSILTNVPVRRYQDGKRITRTETIVAKGKGRMITQGSNLLIGKWHYFRSYTRPYVGRVNVDTDAVEYLELPLQLVRQKNAPDEFIWYKEPPKSVKTSKDKSGQIQNQGIPNEVKNSRGHVVMGDRRSAGNGWGHIAAPTITVAGGHLYLPVMNGTVYVLNWNAEVLDENALVAINDLGPAGKSWTRASISIADGKLFAHTIRELICIAE